MIYTIFVLFIFSAVLLITKYTNKYSIILCSACLFLNISIISTTIYLAKIGYYRYPDSELLLLDYKGYVLLSKINIPFYWISRLQNIGFAGFLACLPFFFYTNSNKRTFLKLLLLSSLLPLFYIVFYDPSTKVSLFFHLYSLDSDSFKTFNTLLIAINTFNYIWIVFYLVFPAIKLIKFFTTSHSLIKRKQLISLIATIVSLNTLCAFIYIIGPFRQTLDVISVDVLLGFPQNNVSPSYHYSYLPLMALILSNIMLFLLFRFRGLDKLDFFKNYIINKSVFKPNKNIKNILHTYKNEMLSINMISKQLKLPQSEEKQQYLINRLNCISENSLNSVTKVLNTFKSQEPRLNYDNVSTCIDRTLSKIYCAQNVEIIKDYEDNIIAYFEPDSLQNVLENIITNSLEAIALAQREHGIINISVSTEYEWIVIKIKDNGIGIPKKDLNKIFKAFYSTKTSSKNWGIGLNYVYKTIKSMKGFVNVKSEYLKSTTFSIMLQNKEDRK